MEPAKKKGPGRPEGTRKVSEPGAPHGAPPILLRLKPDLSSWVRAKPEGAQKYIEKLLNMARELENT